MRTDIITGEDGLSRCGWAGSDPLSVAYHDLEWGRPVHDDDRLFELLSLEAFQSGLSWSTILRKREGFRHAFAGFRITEVAAFGPPAVDRLLGDASIVRHRGKIEATLANARAAAALKPGLAAFVWSFAEEQRSVRPRALADLPSSTQASVALAKALRHAGFRFVGPTTAYAFMQAAGIVDDHLDGCCVAERSDAATS